MTLDEGADRAADEHDHPPTTALRLVDAALVVVGRDGITGASARAIAAEAGVNQALVFYHHDSVDNLLAAASRRATAARLVAYQERLAAVASFAELVAAARDLHEAERRNGHLVVLTQLLAGARTRPILAAALRANFALLVAPVEATVLRLTEGSVVADVVSVPALARTIAGGYLGLELLDGIVTDIDVGPFDALETIAAVIDLALQAGTIETAVLRRRLRAVEASHSTRSSAARPAR